MHSRFGHRPEIPQNFRLSAIRVEKPRFFNALMRAEPAAAWLWQMNNIRTCAMEIANGETVCN